MEHSEKDENFRQWNKRTDERGYTNVQREKKDKERKKERRCSENEKNIQTNEKRPKKEGQIKKEKIGEEDYRRFGEYSNNRDNRDFYRREQEEGGIFPRGSTDFRGSEKNNTKYKPNYIRTNGESFSQSSGRGLYQRGWEDETYDQFGSDSDESYGLSTRSEETYSTQFGLYPGSYSVQESETSGTFGENSIGSSYPPSEIRPDYSTQSKPLWNKTTNPEKRIHGTEVFKEDESESFTRTSYSNSPRGTSENAIGPIISDEGTTSIGRISSRNVGNFDRTDQQTNSSTGTINKTEKEITRTKREISNIERKINSTERGIINISREITTKEIINIKQFDSNDGLIEIPHIKSDVKIRRFTDYRPVDNGNYFSKPRNLSKEKDGLAVVIPFFNEPSHELQQTLNSLHITWTYLQQVSKKWSKKKLYVFIVQDGWHKADKSMKEYLKILFPKKIHGQDWWDYYPEFTDYDQKRDGSISFVFEKKGDKVININPQKTYKDLNRTMKITLMVKINNRRKHNSHEWYMGKNGFAESVNAEYLFMTDAFTLFNKTCLYHLINYMDNDHKISAVTGRQRVMTRDQQGSHEGLFSFGYVLRMVQLFDFELTNAVYNGAFSMGGCLPVIPGPCGMYRASDLLQEKVRGWYFDVINSDPDKTGTILGNLRIAEDRLLSYASVMKTEKERYMAFNPLAIFYFEGETDLRKFVLQRRRWINGSVAGYIYLLFFGFMHFQKWNANFFRKFYIWILLFCQFMIYLLVSVAPALSIRIIYYELRYVLGINGINAETQLMVTMIILWAMYILHVFVHHRYRFNYAIMYMLALVSTVTTIVSLGSLAYHIFVISDKTFLENIIEGGPIAWLGIFVFIGPFFLALLLSGKAHSPLLMIKAVISYYIMLPMLVAWFGSYAYSRTWDLSWGNRPADEVGDLDDGQRKFLKKKIKEDSIKLILFLIILNIGVFFVPLEGQLIIMTTFFVLASIQMVFSLIFMIIKIFYKIGFVFKKCRICCKGKNDIPINDDEMNSDSYDSSDSRSFDDSYLMSDEDSFISDYEYDSVYSNDGGQYIIPIF